MLERFLNNLRELDVRPDEGPLLVALSGGCDSVVLLHLLRFGAARADRTEDVGRAAPPLVAAHLDHALRPDSAADAEWVHGLCRAWGVPLRAERLSAAPPSEAAARRARYRFLRTAAAEAGAPWVLTAHHADDQAETVLFRALRGTGLRGLRGIAARVQPRRPGGPGLLRPLLPFRRDEIHAYARAAGLSWREDATNRSLDFARNRIRHVLLPEAERVAPGARRALVRLAREAREAEAALDAEAARAAAELARPEGAAWLLARDRLRAYDAAVASRVLRRVLRRFGVVPDRSGTRSALQFITDSPSGRELHLPRGLRIRTEFDVARVERAAGAPPEDRPLRIARAEPSGTGVLRLGGCRYRVRWWTEAAGAPAGAGAPSGPRWRAEFDAAALAFPLLLRARRPGDRVRTPGGTKSLKKLMVERRVARSLRPQLPVLEDADGRVVWVAGLGLPPAAPPRPARAVLFLAFEHGGPEPDSQADRGA